MQVTIDEAGTAAKVTLVGRLDIAGAEAIDLPLATLSGHKSRIVVDMAGVTFIASIGLRHLLSAAKKVGRNGGELVIVNPTETVTEVIVTSGLQDLLKIETGPAAKD